MLNITRAFKIAFCLINPLASYAQGTASVNFVAPASMPSARCCAAVTVLDGYIYVIGGNDSSGKILNTVEVYDPAKNTWNSKAPLRKERANPAAVSIKGKIYVFGGSPNGKDVVPTVEIYDPKSNTWKMGKPMLTPRNNFGVAIIDGRVYAVGGADEVGSVVEVFDPSTGKWTAKAPMPTPRYGLAIAVVNGVLYAIGGSSHRIATGVVEAYDPVHDLWTRKATMPTARHSFASGVINGVIYAAGGSNETVEVGAFEAYDPAQDKWSALVSMPTPRAAVGSAVVDSNLYVLGGVNAAGYQSLVEAYSARSNSWVHETVLPSHATGYWEKEYGIGTPYAKLYNVGIQVKDIEKAENESTKLVMKAGGKATNTNYMRGMRGSAPGKVLNYELPSAEADRVAKKIMRLGMLEQFDVQEQTSLNVLSEIKDQIRRIEDEMSGNSGMLRDMPVASALLTSRLNRLRKSADSYDPGQKSAMINLTLYQSRGDSQEDKQNQNDSAE